jgi:hypothetical protein
MEKKKVYLFVMFFVFLSLFFINLVIAEESNLGVNDTNISSLGLGNLSSGADKFLSAQVELPNEVEQVIRSVFRFSQDQNIDLAIFIVLIAVSVLFFAIIYSIVKMLPLVRKGVVSLIVSIILVFIFMASGSIRDISLFFFGLGATIKFLNQFGILKVIFVVLVLTIISLGFKAFMSMVSKQQKEAEARQTGMRLAVDAGVARRASGI